ncbi:MAG TPA: metallophosphoesterase [Verrucomicrobiae bacterium]|nr:metallophosphoesterase [Verrucomicrobiae bacterium]
MISSSKWLQILSRRGLLKRGVGVAASVAAAHFPLGAAEEDSSDSSTSSPSLVLPPFLSRPTGTSIRISAFNGKIAGEIGLELRQQRASDWPIRLPVVKADDHEQLDWNVTGLSPGTQYEYRLVFKRGTSRSNRSWVAGSFRTQRLGPARYTAVLMTDSHTGYFPLGSGPTVTLDRVVRNAARVKGDFVLDLGDNVAWAGSREYAQEDGSGAFEAYAQYRRQIAPLSLHAPHFALIGNWAGESGKFPRKSIQLAGEVRRALLPGPNHLTYPQGGSAGEDYYAFSWGDALYVFLNIQTYSKPSDPKALTSLMLDVNGVEEWTLGEKQRSWFETTLRQAKERFRFVCMHHAAGGNAGDRLNTEYGRGGARAWNTGEQAKIHALMKKYKVQIFFYGHDHVFVDDVVDDIHYTLPGSCGAPWKFTKAETGYERFWPDSGHAELEVSPDQATVTFVNTAGKILHRFSVSPA